MLYTLVDLDRQEPCFSGAKKNGKPNWIYYSTLVGARCPIPPHTPQRATTRLGREPMSGYAAIARDESGVQRQAQSPMSTGMRKNCASGDFCPELDLPAGFWDLLAPLRRHFTPGSN